MLSIVNNEKYGEIKYNESFWTGKKELSIDGKNYYKVSKTKFTYGYGEELVEVYVIGSFLSGVKITIGNDTIMIVEKTKPYEWILAFIPFIFIITWGNSRVLCSIFPVVGGAIGGFISGGCAAASLMFMKKQKTAMKKLLVGLIACVASIFACFLLAVTIQLV